MLFSSIPFAYYFLPAVLVLYFAVPFQFKNAVLLAFSLVFYGWGEPKLVLLMVFNIFFNYLGGFLVDKFRHDQKKKKLFLILSLAKTTILAKAIFLKN